MSFKDTFTILETQISKNSNDQNKKLNSYFIQTIIYILPENYNFKLNLTYLSMIF